MNRNVNILLEGIRMELGFLEEESGPGDLGAVNEPDVEDAIGNFIESLVAALQDRYDISEDDALEFITGMADMLKDEGMLPPLPAEDDPEVIKAEWLGAAKANGLATEIMQAAEEIAVD